MAEHVDRDRCPGHPGCGRPVDHQTLDAVLTGLALDAPGTRCAFESHGCSHLASRCGGFDEHHRDPPELGGDPKQPLLALCPLHHRRQHSLIRYLIECYEADPGTQPAWVVLVHFTPVERDTATHAVAQWIARGRPSIKGWPCPAARA